jgi:trans-aconitate methyltransferase
MGILADDQEQPMSLQSAIVRQFSHPAGPAGRAAGWIMANRPSNRARNAWTLSLLDVHPADRVLELGFDPGYALSLLAPRLAKGSVVGIDHSAAMLKQARQRNARWIAAGRVRLVQGGVDALADFAPASFDRIYSSNFLQFITDQEALLATLLMLLTPGGRLATTYQPRHRGASDADTLQFAGKLRAQMVWAGYSRCRLEHNDRFGVMSACVLGHAPR